MTEYEVKKHFVQQARIERADFKERFQRYFKELYLKDNDGFYVNGASYSVWQFRTIISSIKRYRLNIRALKLMGVHNIGFNWDK